VKAVVVTGVEMREFASCEEGLIGPNGRRPIEEQRPRPGHRDAAGALTHAWEREYSLGETPANVRIRGLLVDLRMGQPGRRDRTRSPSDG